jgi:hypothetical protein
MRQNSDTIGKPHRYQENEKNHVECELNVDGLAAWKRNPFAF